MKKLSLSLLSLAALCASFAVAAQNVEEKKVFSESPLVLPSAPDAASLLLFYESDTQSFYLDTKSITIAADGSLRYTMVGKSRSGASNVSYEGLLCETKQKRLFAFGRKDGSWSESRRTDWESISNNGVNRQHSTLAWDFVCDYDRISGSIDKILHRIRRNESLQRSP